MRKILLQVMGMALLFAVQAVAFDLPEFEETVATKIRMPGGISYGMAKNDVISLLKKRHSVEIFDSGAGYQVTQNGITETYSIRFKCDRVWAIGYYLSGTEEEKFYGKTEPLKRTIEKLRQFYFGPVYGAYKIKVKLLDDENISLDIWDDVYDGKPSINIELYWGDYSIEPTYNCNEKQ